MPAAALDCVSDWEEVGVVDRVSLPQLTNAPIAPMSILRKSQNESDDLTWNFARATVKPSIKAASVLTSRRRLMHGRQHFLQSASDRLS